LAQITVLEARIQELENKLAQEVATRQLFEKKFLEFQQRMVSVLNSRLLALEKQVVKMDTTIETPDDDNLLRGLERLSVHLGYGSIRETS
jgi:hypothetical protein